VNWNTICFAKEDPILDEACHRLGSLQGNTLNRIEVDFLDTGNIMRSLKKAPETIPYTAGRYERGLS
jgi:hypothetical protein